MLISGCIAMNRPHRDHCMMNQSVRCDDAISGRHENIVIKHGNKAGKSSIYVHGPPSGGLTPEERPEWFQFRRSKTSTIGESHENF